jgi:hypothetical protein
MTCEERKVLAFLVDKYSSYEDAFYSCFAPIMAETALSRREVRRACRSLARKGLAKYERGLWSEDGGPAGSGYSATRKAVVEFAPPARGEAA